LEKHLKELYDIVSKNAGAGEFVELAKLLASDPSKRSEARDICFKGLTESPDNLLGRLLLSRLFYLDKMPEFCVRELLELKRRGGSFASLDKLLSSLSDYAEPYLTGLESASSENLGEDADNSAPKVVAEVDLDEDFLDILDELDKDK
jgi:hypothetical protein